MFRFFRKFFEDKNDGSAGGMLYAMMDQIVKGGVFINCNNSEWKKW